MRPMRRFVDKNVDFDYKSSNSFNRITDFCVNSTISS